MPDDPKPLPPLDSKPALTVDEDLVELVVELESIVPSDDGLSRMEKIAARREAFERDAAPVAEAIASAGGEVVGQTWINQTLKARVPRDAVEALGQLENVAQVDLPRPLELELEGEN